MSRKILIVDDQEVNRKLLRVQLGAEGFNTVEASDGQEALGLLKKQRVDAIISDILMPRMDGYRLCYEVRKDPKLKALPFIFYTATYTSPADEKLAAQTGGDKYLKKPASIRDIIQAVQDLTAGKKPRVGRRPVPVKELHIMKKYSEVLVKKLEEKNQELESAIIELGRRNEEVQRNLERIRALHEIDTAITSSLDVRRVLDILLEKIDLSLPYSAATIRLWNKESRLLEPIACRNLDEREWKATEWKGGRGSPNIVFESKAALTIGNCQTDSRIRDPEFFRKHSLVSYLGVPLIAHDEILGVISFYTKEEHEFTSDEIEFLATLASQAAIAIHNSQLYQESDRSRRELELTNQYLERSLGQLSGLHTALTPLSPSESVHQMMDGIIERLIEATGADAALIRLRDAKTGTYRLAAQRGFPDNYFSTVNVSLPSGAADWVSTNGEPIIAPDIASEPRFVAKVQLRVGFRSAAMLPLKVHDEVYGIINLSSRKLGYFDEEQRDHLMAIARQMGIALENRELFDDLKASKDELDKAVKVKDEFLSVMSHELRTPLNVVMGYTGMIRDGMLGEINPKQEEALEKVIRRTNDQLSLVNNVLFATVLETGKVNIDIHEVSLGDLLGQLKLDQEAPINKELSLNWDYASDLPAIKTDSAKLKQILRNLIDNAIKFTIKGSVTVAARIRQRWVEFTVADTGVGIPKEHLSIIFEKFRQVDSSETRLFGGVGMGLYVAKRFAELLGGSVEVESEVGKGSTFTVKLPV